MSRGHLRRRRDVEITFVHQPLDEIVQHLRELCLRLWCAFAAQRLEHLRGELIRRHERVDDRLPQRIEGSIVLVAEVEAEARGIIPARKSRLQEEIRELVEQRLKVDCVGEFGAELGIRVAAHDGLRIHYTLWACIRSTHSWFSSVTAISGSSGWAR